MSLHTLGNNDNSFIHPHFLGHTDGWGISLSKQIYGIQVESDGKSYFLKGATQVLEIEEFEASWDNSHSGVYILVAENGKKVFYTLREFNLDTEKSMRFGPIGKHFEVEMDQFTQNEIAHRVIRATIDFADRVEILEKPTNFLGLKFKRNIKKIIENGKDTPIEIRYIGDYEVKT